MNTLKNAYFINKKSFFVISIFLLAVLLSSFTNSGADQSDDGEFIVVLDAGHGGHDPGNLGNGYLEKNIALNIVLHVGSILEKTPGIKVVYTRKDDTFVDLFVRGEIANKADADLFVSVHCDSHSSDAHGAGTFVLGLHANKQNFEIAKKENSVIYLEDNYETRYADYDINSPESIIGLTIMQEEFLDQSIVLAKNIQDNFSKKLKRKDREVKQAGFIVLHQTFMPSVLVETGFLTNDEEGAYLNSKKGQMDIGTAIADAVLEYKAGVQPRTERVSAQENTAQAQYDPYDVPKVKPVTTEEPVKTVAKTAEKEKLSAPAVAEAKKAVKGETPVGEDVINASGTQAPVVAKTKEELTDRVDAVTDDVPVSQEIVLAKEQPKVTESVKEAPKPVEVKKEVAKNEAAPAVAQPKGNTKNIIFKVQLMATTKDISLTPGNFNGLNELSKESFQAFRRYLYGSTDSYEQAKLLKANADAKGYTTSYIVAYKDGERISTPDAIKLVSQ